MSNVYTNYNHLNIDVVGIVQNLRPKVISIKNNIETRRLMFDITDGRYIILSLHFVQFKLFIYTLYDQY